VSLTAAPADKQQQLAATAPPVQSQLQAGILQKEASFDWDSIDLVDSSTPRTPSPLMPSAFPTPSAAAAAEAAVGAVGTLAGIAAPGTQLDPEVASILRPEDAATYRQLLQSHAGHTPRDAEQSATSQSGSRWGVGSPRLSFSPRPGTMGSSSGSGSGSGSGVRKPGMAAVLSKTGAGRLCGGGSTRIGLQFLDMALLEPVSCDISYSLSSSARKHGGSSSSRTQAVSRAQDNSSSGGGGSLTGSKSSRCSCRMGKVGAVGSLPACK
jgi:hypothetical protein